MEPLEETGSLVELAGRGFREEEPLEGPPEEPELPGRVVYPDGYVRRSPVQHYRISPGYKRRERRLALLGVLAAAVLLLAAVVALSQFGVFNIQVF